MGNVSQVRNSNPKFEILNLLLVGLVLNLNASSVANEVEFFLFELVNLLE